MTFTGEVLASDTIDPVVELQYVGAVFNDIFRGAHEACEKVGLEAASQAVFIAPKGIIVMMCSGVSSKTHFHLLVILDTTGNEALAKMTLDKLVPKVMEEL